MNPQETHAAVVEMLRTSGLPMTTDNLNRAMQAVAQGEMLQQQPDAGAGIERSMQRVMQPRQLPIPPTPPVSLEQIEQTPQAIAGNDPGVMYDAMPESYVSQRRGTLQRSRYEGDTGPAADWPGRDIDPNAVGTVLMLSPWLGAGAARGVNMLRNMPKPLPATVTPSQAAAATSNAAKPLTGPLPMNRAVPKQGVTTPHRQWRGEAVDDFTYNAPAQTATQSPIQFSNVANYPGQSTTLQAPPASSIRNTAPLQTTTSTLKDFMARQKYTAQPSNAKTSNAERKASKSD